MLLLKNIFSVEIITARGVTSALDLGLYVCEKLAGHQVKERIRKQMDYMQ